MKTTMFIILHVAYGIFISVIPSDITNRFMKLDISPALYEKTWLVQSHTVEAGRHPLECCFSGSKSAVYV